MYVSTMQTLASQRSVKVVVFAVLCFFFLMSKRALSVPYIRASLAHGYSKDWSWAIRNRTLGFEKIMVVSLPDRYDKRDVWTLAADATDLSLTWVDGVRGEDVPIKAAPPGWDFRVGNTTLGCYRGHLNAFQQIVSERLSSALIFEDDAEWDVTIKSQLVEFARGLHYLQDIQNPNNLSSPYGDDWDVLWIGYCGAKSRSGDRRYYVTHNDPTVVPEELRTEKRVGGRVLDDSTPDLQSKYMRVVSEPYNLRCLYAYAVSLRGARKFLYNFAVAVRPRTADVAVSEFCSDNVAGAKCYSPYPQFVDNYLPAGDTSKASDRRLFRPGFRKEGTSQNIVFPVKTNLQIFVQGGTSYPSQWPGKTLMDSITPDSFVFPRGQGLYLSKEQFNTPAGY